MAPEHDEQKDTNATPDGTSRGAALGATHGGHAGSGLGLTEESRARAQTEELSEGAGDPTAGQGTSLDARPGTAQEMTGGESSVGDTSIRIPRGGSLTRGAAQGAGMSRDLADPGSTAASEPGAGGDITGSVPATPRPGDPEHSGLGEGAPGGQLDELDDSFSRRGKQRR